mgnify:CR=1 FL=1
MKISRSLVAAALSGALVLGGTTAAIAQIPEAADTTNVPLPASVEVDGVTYFKKTKTNDKGVEEEYYANAAGDELSVVQVKALVDKSNASKDEEEESESTSSEETTSETATTSEKATTSAKTTEPKASESASATNTKSSETSASATTTKSSETSASATTTKSSDSSTTASATTTPSSSKSAEPTPSKDKKSSARDALSSKDGKPTPLAIFGIVAGVLAAVAAAFPVIAKTLNLNIKLPF